MSSPSGEGPARAGGRGGVAPGRGRPPGAAAGPERPPARGDGAAGWLLPSLLFLVGGAAYVVALAWARLLPAHAPAPAALTGAALAVALGAFAMAVTFALDAATPPGWWRPTVVLLLAAGALVAPASCRSHALWTAAPAFVLLLLAARAAETAGAHLAPALAAEGAAEAAPPAGRRAATQRVVLEAWLAGGAAAVAGRGRPVTAALLVMVAGGLGLVAGVQLLEARRLASRADFVFEARDVRAVWGGAAVVALAALAAAAALPHAPALLPDAIPRLATWLAARFRPRTPPPQAPGSTFGVTPGLREIASSPVAQGTVLGVAFLGDLLYVVAAVLAVALAVYYLRTYRGDWRAILRHLWRLLREVLAFWRWVRPGAGAGGEPGRAAAPSAARGGGASAGGAFGRLDARRLVRLAYRRFRRGAAQGGRPRPPGRTPAEFAREVGPPLGAAAGDVAALTGAYEEARYSAHPVPREAVPPVRAALARALAALRRRR